MMSYAQWGNALYSGEKSHRIVPKRRIFVRAALAVIAICAILIRIHRRFAIHFDGSF